MAESSHYPFSKIGYVSLISKVNGANDQFPPSEGGGGVKILKEKVEDVLSIIGREELKASEAMDIRSKNKISIIDKDTFWCNQSMFFLKGCKIKGNLFARGSIVAEGDLIVKGWIYAHGSAMINGSLKGTADIHVGRLVCNGEILTNGDLTCDGALVNGDVKVNSISTFRDLLCGGCIETRGPIKAHGHLKCFKYVRCRSFLEAENVTVNLFLEVGRGIRVNNILEVLDPNGYISAGLAPRDEFYSDEIDALWVKGRIKKGRLSSNRKYI